MLGLFQGKDNSPQRLDLQVNISGRNISEGM